MSPELIRKAREIAAEVLREEGVDPDCQARAYTDLLARVALRAIAATSPSTASDPRTGADMEEGGRS